MEFVIGRVNVRPSALFKRLMKHRGEISEGDRYKIIATRTILGRKVDFYRNQLRVVHGTNLTEEESYNSELLRFAHASILINGPVGDKKICWIDATQEPVELWLYNRKMNKASDLNTREVFNLINK